MEHCAEKYGLLPHIRFGTAVEEARFDEDAALWRIRTSDGEEHEAEVLVSGVGQLHKPYVPEIPGLGDFAGVEFHSARWRHDVDLAGKRVGVIGNAASAIQFIPQIAPEVQELVVFQRTPNWMIRRNDHPYSEREQWLLAHVPGLSQLYRLWIWGRAEVLLYPVIRGNRFLSRALEKQCRDYLREGIPDPELRKVLTPDYPVCGKRVLISDDYYDALRRENVTLETSAIERVLPDGVACKDGSRHDLDVLILATGFDTTHFVSPIRVTGRDGRSLEDTWKDGAEAYLGLTVAGFPNFFLMYGPNTNLGHNSIIFMIECQTRYIVQCVKKLRDEGIPFLDLRPEVMESYNREVQQDLRGTAWDRTAHSWYKNEAGRITNNWPHSTLAYWWRTRRPEFANYTAS
jgi:cation diffusion facilitator CzcD-associated flavoprotein CzcO